MLIITSKNYATKVIFHRTWWWLKYSQLFDTKIKHIIKTNVFFFFYNPLKRCIPHFLIQSLFENPLKWRNISLYGEAKCFKNFLVQCPRDSWRFQEKFSQFWKRTAQKLKHLAKYILIIKNVYRTYFNKYWKKEQVSSLNQISYKNICFKCCWYTILEFFKRGTAHEVWNTLWDKFSKTKFSLSP